MSDRPFTELEADRVLAEGPPSAEEFRKAGMSSKAALYPYTEERFLRLCKFNGVAPEKAPRHWFYAANAYMQTWDYDVDEAIQKTREPYVKRDWGPPIGWKTKEHPFIK